MDIKFTFSIPYQKSLSDKEVVFPTEILEQMDAFWKENKEIIQSGLEQITGLQFNPEKITCYLNTEFSISDPFSLRIEDIEDMKDNLIHELIHILMTQNEFSKSKRWKDLMDYYKDESPATKVHIIVHRVHYILYHTRLRRDRIQNITGYSERDAYVRAWQIAVDERNMVDKLLDL